MYSSYFNPIILKVESFVKQMNTKPILVPQKLAQMENIVRDSSFLMKSQAWSSDKLAYLRLTHLSSSPHNIELFNFAIYPHFCYKTPLFASDFVLIKDNIRVAVIDAMPIFPNDSDYHKHYVKPFSELFEKSLKLGEAYERKLDWSFHYLGEFACLRKNIDLSHLSQLFNLWSAYLNIYTSFISSSFKSSTAEQEAIKNWQNKYNQEHLNVELNRNPLMHYFGKDLGTAYLNDFLFKSHF